MARRGHRQSDQPRVQVAGLEAGVWEGMVQAGTGSSDKEAINDTVCYLLPSRSPVTASHSILGESINDGEWINKEARVVCGCLCWT